MENGRSQLNLGDLRAGQCWAVFPWAEGKGATWGPVHRLWRTQLPQDGCCRVRLPTAFYSVGNQCLGSYARSEGCLSLSDPTVSVLGERSRENLNLSRGGREPDPSSERGAPQKPEVTPKVFRAAFPFLYFIPAARLWGPEAMCFYLSTFIQSEWVLTLRAGKIPIG